MCSILRAANLQEKKNNSNFKLTLHAIACCNQNNTLLVLPKGWFDFCYQTKVKRKCIKSIKNMYNYVLNLCNLYTCIYLCSSAWEKKDSVTILKHQKHLFPLKMWPLRPLCTLVNGKRNPKPSNKHDQKNATCHRLCLYSSQACWVYQVWTSGNHHIFCWPLNQHKRRTW